MKERLQKILVKAGLASRRGAEELILKGLVTVDGRIVSEMGLKVDSANQRVEYKGSRVSIEKELIYILLNKPTGYITTLKDPQGRPIVTSLLKGVEKRVFPVGRLDLNTSGALLMTNDGSLAQKIQHPSYEVTKTYIAKVKGCPDRKRLGRIEKGIMLEGKRTWPAKVRILTKGKNQATVEVIIHEGKKRQIRKMFAAIGHPVQDLKRVAYGRLQIGELPSGKFRFLVSRDLDLIFFGTSVSSVRPAVRRGK